MKVYVNTLPKGQGFYVTTQPSSTGVVQSSTIMKGILTEKRLVNFTNQSKAMLYARQAFLGYTDGVDF